MSNFVVSARKYRPQRFEDVVGQQHVAGTLKNALATDHVAHAFLFTGPRGVGKTTCARILAKILNCENRTKDYEACNVCSSCKSFNENASFNIIELDAASNNSVEHIRALTEQVRFQPQHGRYKVFIIDEVHMLSNQAFNAFLKTLEEPPPYAIFILATTEKHKIIPTILSRCQIFDFRRITVADMVLHLQNICGQENIIAEEDALHIISQKADGALRDALSIFDRITSFSGKKIGYNDVIENLNILDYDYYFQVTDALLAEDAPAILNLFDLILRKGFEPDIFVNGLAEHLRNILVCKDETTLALLEVGEALKDRYRKQAALTPSSFILTALNFCNDCDINFKMARHKRLHVEMALLKMCYIQRAVQATLQEKKNPVHRELTPVSNPTPALPTNGHSNEANGHANNGNGTAYPVSKPISLTVNEPPNAHILTTNEIKTLVNGLETGSRKLEKIPLSLDAYEKAVVKEDAHIASLQTRFTLVNAQTEWDLFASTLDSPILKQVMKGATLSIQDKILFATVGMTTHRSMLQQEATRLLDFLRHKLHDPVIKVRFEIDEIKVQEQAILRPAKPITTREKLENMKVLNASVTDLISRFELNIITTN